MTKAEIVQNLLNAYQITPEQAVILLTPEPSRVWIEPGKLSDDTVIWPSIPNGYDWQVRPEDLPYYQTNSQ